MADGTPEQGILHLDFKLAKNNEEIALYCYDNESLIDSIPTRSVGRIEDGLNEWSNTLFPTPMAPNSVSLNIPANEEFSMTVLPYPNPFANTLNVRLFNNRRQYCDVSVYSLSGSKLSSI